MNDQTSRVRRISVELTEGGWTLDEWFEVAGAGEGSLLQLGSRTRFGYHEHPSLMVRLVESTQAMAPGPIREALEEIWEERGRAVVEGIVEEAQDRP